MAYNRTWNDAVSGAAWNTAQPVGVPRLKQPFAGDPTYYVLEQDYQQTIEDFNPLTLNTAFPPAQEPGSFAGYYLASESALTDMSNGVGQWTRTYAYKPNTRNDYASLAYSFIGYGGALPNPNVASTTYAWGRNRKTVSVTCRIQYDYYLVGPQAWCDYTDASLIPVIREQLYYIPQGNVVGSVFVPDFTRGSANDISAGLAYDYIWDAVPGKYYIGTLIPTYPHRTEYLALITAGSEIVAEPSQLSRWMGNFYVRATKYVVAQ